MMSKASEKKKKDREFYKRIEKQEKKVRGSEKAPEKPNSKRTTWRW